MAFRSAALVIAALVTAACSSSTETKTPSTSDSGAAAANEDSDAGTTAAAPAAPKITMIMKMSGALHVSWTNVEKSCDSIEGERQAQMADGSIMEKYKVVFTVPGDADNKHDTTATEDMKYTYRLRCKKAGTYSDYSNEMSANPVR